MSTERPTFTPHFEEGLVQALMLDHSFAQQIKEVLKFNYFSRAHLRAITGELYAYYDTYGEFPSVDMLKERLERNAEHETLAAAISKYFAKISKEPLNGDAAGIKDESLEFCRKQNLFHTLERCLTLTESKKFDQIVKEITDAVALGAERDSGHVWEDQFDERMAESRRKPVATPWQPINDITTGGLSAGELGVILALTGVGKSHALVDLGAHAAMNGLSVVHLTFELSEIKTGKRYDARIADVEYDALKEHQEHVAACVGALKGKIRIKKYPNRKANVQTIRSYLSKLKIEGFEPDLLIVDYADIMQSTKSYENKRFEEEAVYEELRSLADELHLPIWTAAQTNRTGMDVDVLTFKHIAECFNKAMVADLFITMNRRKNGNNETLGNFFVAKNRVGTDGMKFNVLVDTARSRIRCLIPGSVDEHEANIKHDLQLELSTEDRVKIKINKMRIRKEAEGAVA